MDKRKKVLFWVKSQSKDFNSISMQALKMQPNRYELNFLYDALFFESIDNQGVLTNEQIELLGLTFLDMEFEKNIELLGKLKLISIQDDEILVDKVYNNYETIQESSIKRKARRDRQKETLTDAKETKEDSEGQKRTLSDNKSKEEKSKEDIDKSKEKKSKINIELDKEEKKIIKDIVSKETLVVLDKPKKPRKDEVYYLQYHTCWQDFLNSHNHAFGLKQTRIAGFKSMIDKIKKYEKKGLTLEVYKEALIEAQKNAWLFGDNDRNWKMDILFLMEGDNRAKLYAGKYVGLKQRQSQKSFNSIINDLDDVVGAPF